VGRALKRLAPYRPRRPYVPSLEGIQVAQGRWWVTDGHYAVHPVGDATPLALPDGAWPLWDCVPLLRGDVPLQGVLEGGDRCHLQPGDAWVTRLGHDPVPGPAWLCDSAYAQDPLPRIPSDVWARIRTFVAQDSSRPALTSLYLHVDATGQLALVATDGTMLARWSTPGPYVVGRWGPGIRLQPLALPPDAQGAVAYDGDTGLGVVWRSATLCLHHPLLPEPYPDYTQVLPPAIPPTVQYDAAAWAALRAQIQAIQRAAPRRRWQVRLEGDEATWITDTGDLVGRFPALFGTTPYTLRVDGTRLAHCIHQLADQPTTCTLHGPEAPVVFQQPCAGGRLEVLLLPLRQRY